ncbi:unnamed protein product [Boreogadus saida]
MSDIDAAKSLTGLLNGIAQKAYHNHGEVTEDLLRTELYPVLSPEDFHALHDKMRGLLKSIAMADMDPGQLEAFLTAQMKRQGSGGMSEGQASALSRFWRSQRARVRESLLAQSRWEPGLRGLAWRVDLQTSSGRGPEAAPGGPVALLELELGRPSQDSEYVRLECDEATVNQVLKKMADIQRSIDTVVHRS